MVFDEENRPPFQQGKIVRPEGISRLFQTGNFEKAVDPADELDIETVEDFSGGMVFDLPCRVFRFLARPLDLKFAVIYLKAPRVRLQVVDQFFSVAFSSSAVWPSSSKAAAIFQDGLTKSRQWSTCGVSFSWVPDAGSTYVT